MLDINSLERADPTVPVDPVKVPPLVPRGPLDLESFNPLSPSLALSSGFDVDSIGEHLSKGVGVNPIASDSLFPKSVIPRVDDYPGNSSTSGVVNIGGFTNGNIEAPGDTDWFRVNLVAGTTYRFRETGLTLSDPYLYLRNSAGTVLASNDDSELTNNSLITYTPTASGTYFLEARAYSSYTGTYLVSAQASPFPVDDYAPINSANIGSVGIGGFSNGNIEATGDTDWFRVNLVAGTTYRFRETGLTLSDPYLYLRNSAGTVVASNDDSELTNNSLITYTPTASGTYFLDARAFSSYTGTYLVSAQASPFPVDDYAPINSANIGLVSIGGSRNGNIEVAGDADWFRVSLVGGVAYQFRQDRLTLADPYLYLRNSAGTILASNDDGGGNMNSLITYTPTTSGTYFLDARAYSSYTGTYTVSTQVMDDYAGNSSTTGVVTIGGSRNGNIEVAGDADWFRVKLIAGKTYRFRETGLTLSDPYLYLRNSAGTLLTSNDDSELTNNSLITYTPTSSGTYFLEARAFGSYTGTYLVSAQVSPFPVDDYAPINSANIGLVNIGGSANGNLEVAGDTDWFRVNLVAGTTYQFRQNRITLADPYLSLRNSAGTVLTSNDDGGGDVNALISYTPTVTGAYYLDAGAYDGAYTGTYTVSAQTFSSTANWTYMVYLDGDNNLEQAGIQDFLEMASVGSNSNVNILVQMDRSGGYDTSYGNWTDTRRGRVLQGNTPTASWGASIGEANMGAQGTLTDFVNWGMTNYQATNYALVLWNHGGGYSGVCWDDTNGGDRLELREVGGALSVIPRRLDLLGADACQMGMVEFAYQLRNNASVLVSSEENIPWYGWSYNTILSDLRATPTMTASQLGTVIVNRYGQYYGTGGNTTLSAVNLLNFSGSGSLATALDGFSSAVMSFSTASDRTLIESARSSAPSFGGNSSSRDLGRILGGIVGQSAITQAIRTAAQNALNAYNAMIIRNFTEIANRGTGLAINFQARHTGLNSYYNANNLALAANTNWDNFLLWWANA